MDFDKIYNKTISSLQKRIDNLSKEIKEISLKELLNSNNVLNTAETIAADYVKEKLEEVVEEIEKEIQGFKSDIADFLEEEKNISGLIGIVASSLDYTNYSSVKSDIRNIETGIKGVVEKIILSRIKFGAVDFANDYPKIIYDVVKSIRSNEINSYIGIYDYKTTKNISIYHVNEMRNSFDLLVDEILDSVNNVLKLDKTKDEILNEYLFEFIEAIYAIAEFCFLMNPAPTDELEKEMVEYEESLINPTTIYNKQKKSTLTEEEKKSFTEYKSVSLKKANNFLNKSMFYKNIKSPMSAMMYFFYDSFKEIYFIYESFLDIRNSIDTNNSTVFDYDSLLENSYKSNIESDYYYLSKILDIMNDIIIITDSYRITKDYGLSEDELSGYLSELENIIYLITPKEIINATVDDKSLLNPIVGKIIKQALAVVTSLLSPIKKTTESLYQMITGSEAPEREIKLYIENDDYSSLESRVNLGLETIINSFSLSNYLSLTGEEKELSFIKDIVKTLSYVSSPMILLTTGMVYVCRDTIDTLEALIKTINKLESELNKITNLIQESNVLGVVCSAREIWNDTSKLASIAGTKFSEKEELLEKYLTDVYSNEESLEKEELTDKINRVKKLYKSYQAFFKAIEKKS